MAEYTLIKIDQLPDGTANLSSKVMFGIGDKIHTTTVAQLLSLFVENNSITPRQVPVNLLVTSSNFTTILLSVNLTIAQNEIVFLTFNALFNNRATLNTYLVPLGAGVYNPLGSEISFQNLILINEQPLEDLESDTNTVTYTVADLDEINDAVVPFDFSDETKVYFVIFGGSLYRFIGDLGLYGDGELQISISDLELISTQANNDFVEKQSFTYLPLSSLGGAPVAPTSLNFITTDGDGVTGFSGFQSGSVFIGQRMIIRNDKTTDFELTPAGLFDFTFDRDYIIKAGDNIEFDFTANGFRQVGIDAISRKGTAVGFPIVGNLSIIGAGLKSGSTSGAESLLYEEDGVFYWQNKNNELATPVSVFFTDSKGLESDVDFSQNTLSELKAYTQRSYVLGVPKSESFTAQNNGRYLTTATLTITDTETENYFVQVQSGVCTIGGVAYVAGDWIWRVGSTSYKINGAGGGGGVTVHNDLTNRDASNAHPISAITDLQTELDARLLKAELTRTPTAGVINTETIFSDRVVILDVGSTDTTVTILSALNNVLFKKQGSGIVTFVSDTGRTLRTLTNNLNVLTADGGMALLFADGTTDNLYVNDGEQPALLKSGYRKGVILDTDFSTVSGTQVANVGLSEAYPDATYEIWLTFYRASGSLFSYHYVIPEASVTSTGFQLILQHGSTPTGLKIKYQTFRDE